MKEGSGQVATWYSSLSQLVSHALHSSCSSRNSLSSQPVQSLAFTSTWADSLFWTVASSSIPAGFGVGLVGGVFGGAFLSALLRGELQFASFETAGQTLRYAAGAALMGFGGVLAGGCTVGAGLSGVSMLSLAALVALGSIAAGALVADRALNRGPVLQPAE